MRLVGELPLERDEVSADDDAPPANARSAATAAALAEVNDTLQPMIEWADGLKKSLIELGWNEATAEAAALEALQGAIRKVLG